MRSDLWSNRLQIKIGGIVTNDDTPVEIRMGGQRRS